jgi:hypothetical protein
MAEWTEEPIPPGTAWQWGYDMRWALLALALLAWPAAAADIPVGGTDLFGAAFGSGVDETVAKIGAALGKPTDDTIRTDECIDRPNWVARWVSWGGLTAEFEPDEDGHMVFLRWGYRLDYPTGKPIPGGPQPEEIIMPQGVRVGDLFSNAAMLYGFVPQVDDVFELAMHFTPTFGFMTSEPDVDAPIMQVGTPDIGFCE